jgi:hypothetical protein
MASDRTREQTKTDIQIIIADIGCPAGEISRRLVAAGYRRSAVPETRGDTVAEEEIKSHGDFVKFAINRIEDICLGLPAQHHDVFRRVIGNIINRERTAAATRMRERCAYIARSTETRYCYDRIDAVNPSNC